MIRLLTLPSPRSRRRSDPIGHSSLPSVMVFRCRHASVAPLKRNRSVALQIFLRPGVDAIERFLDVLDRVRHAEAKITFAEVAERGAGQCSDACVIEERVGQLFRWPSSLRDIREDIERAMWEATGETFDFVERQRNSRCYWDIVSWATRRISAANLVGSYRKTKWAECSNQIIFFAGALILSNNRTVHGVGSV